MLIPNLIWFSLGQKFEFLPVLRFLTDYDNFGFFSKFYFENFLNFLFLSLKRENNDSSSKKIIEILPMAREILSFEVLKFWDYLKKIFVGCKIEAGSKKIKNYIGTNKFFILNLKTTSLYRQLVFAQYPIFEKTGNTAKLG